MDEKKIRINKYIADAGICSRRDADKLVEQGLVMVNGRFAESDERIRYPVGFLEPCFPRNLYCLMSC